MCQHLAVGKCVIAKPVFEVNLVCQKQYHDYKVWSLVTSLYSHDIILVLFQWIIKQDYKNKYFVTGDWGQSKVNPKSSDIITLYHTYPRSWTRPFEYLVTSKLLWRIANCKPWAKYHFGLWEQFELD